MNQPSDNDRPDAAGASVAPNRRLLALGRPHPDETNEEFAARFLAQLLEAQRSLQQQPGSDGD